MPISGGTATYQYWVEEEKDGRKMLTAPPSRMIPAPNLPFIYFSYLVFAKDNGVLPSDDLTKRCYHCLPRCTPIVDFLQEKVYIDEQERADQKSDNDRLGACKMIS
jgi:hypothetical protein